MNAPKRSSRVPQLGSTSTSLSRQQESRRLLAYHNAGRHCVAGRYTRHNGSICNTEAVHAVDLQLAIDHRHCIQAIFAVPD